MNKTTEALKLAEEALVYHTQQTRPIQKTDEALAAVREVLAEQDHSATSSKPITKPVKQDTPYCKSVPMCAKPCGDESCVEPVKQEEAELEAELPVEPVAWMNTNGAVNKLREAGWAMNTAPVPPVKQEPVACIRWIPKLENVRSEYFEYGWSDGKKLPVGTQLYAAPVDAKAIRDALLFLVERCNEQGFYSPIKQPIVQTALAAIRGLK